ncbi:MAG: RecQ family ATP-dependent DNA helicase [Deltaproteobacteria bacterium]|nr:RecQ family ATP-dependent DNA helicase [Deltaproteobacteria bacterium]
MTETEGRKPPARRKASRAGARKARATSDPEPAAPRRRRTRSAVADDEAEAGAPARSPRRRSRGSMPAEERDAALAAAREDDDVRDPDEDAGEDDAALDHAPPGADAELDEDDDTDDTGDEDDDAADTEDDEDEDEAADDEAAAGLDAATLSAALRAAAAPVDEAVASREDEEERLAAAPPPRRRRTARAAPLGELPPVPAPLSVDAAARRIGIDALYPEQQEVVRAVADGRDVLLVLPTGFGKSACYQVPAMVLPRPVVVVSPLLALLEDQHTKLQGFGVRVARLDGTVRGNARKQALADVARGGPILVMTTPETLGSPELRSALAGPGVGLVAVDEAHCISEWGYDFRPAYRRLGARVRELGEPPVLALTATATEHVREAIVGSLGMREPEVIAASPHRSNLAFEVLPCERDLRLRGLLRLARRLHRPGIIYCATRREVELIYLLIRRFGIPAHRYHGGMTAKERESEQEKFMDSGRRVVMVATSAFGLGIDKPDIRYVLHFQAPASLEQYVQEAGRSGRDGKKANCILLYDGSDRSIHEALLSRSRVRPDQLYRLAAALAAWADEEREPTLEALALSAEMGPRIAAALLTKLEEGGLVAFDDERIQVLGNKDTFERDARALAGQFETLRTQDGHRLDALAEYARDEGCRAKFLRNYFGESEGEACGLCDVCRGRPERPEAFFAPIAKPAQPGRRRRGGRTHEERGRRGRGRLRPAEREPRERRFEGDPGPGRRRRGRRGGRGRRAGGGPESLIAPEILARPFVLDEADVRALPPERPRRQQGERGGEGRAPQRTDDAEGTSLPRRRRGRRGGRRRRGRGRGHEPRADAPPDPQGDGTA